MLEKSAVTKRQTRTKGKVCAVPAPRFSSSITPHLNAVMQMRYQENRSVDEVLAWLNEQHCEISRRSYHDFMLRVLHFMPLAQAKDLNVNPALLRAVRVRYKLPVNPKGGRFVVGKTLPRHNCRQRRRRILVEPKSKRRPALTPPTRPSFKPAFEADQLPLAGMVAPPSEAPKMRGTPDAPQGYGDWKIINGIARKKVFRKDRQMILNMQGTVIHLRTRQEYTPERLMAEFELTAPEAESCFMTFTQ